MNKDAQTSPCLEGQNLSWKAHNKAILHNINLQLYPGEVLGIIGPNGAGKSSLLKVLAGLLKPNSGSTLLKGKTYQDFNSKHFSQNLSYLEQQASVHWPLLVGKVIELGRLPYQGFSQKLSLDDHTAIENAVSATGVQHLLTRVFTDLSEGEKMLVALTRIIASQTKIILADEPVAALDPYHQLLIMALLQNITRRNEDHAVVVVLHDLSLAARFCDRLILLNEGSIVSHGTIKTVLSTENLRLFYNVNGEIDSSNNSVLISSLVK